MHTSKWVIYALLDPDSNAVRYVGKSGYPKDRRLSYENGYGAHPGSPLDCWLTELRCCGKSPVFVELFTLASHCEIYAKSPAAILETAVIQHYSARPDGHLLLNVTCNARRKRNRKPQPTT